MLSENQLALLEHVGQYRLTTIDAVHRLLYSQQTREAARVALYRLAEQDLLTRFEIRNRSFYQLSRKGCAQIGAPKNASQPFATQALVERYAFLCFCMKSPASRRRITPQAFGDVFPELIGAHKIDPSLQHYYLDEAGEELRFGRVTVDNGSDVRRLADKCREIGRDVKSGPLQSLVADNAFVLTVLTVYPSKAARILAVLTKQPPAIAVQVEVVPEMRHVL